MNLGSLALGVLLAVPGLARAQAFGDLVQTQALTAYDERRVGELTFALSTGTLPMVTDEATVARVETVLRRVVRASERPGQVVQLRIVDDPTINASAYPGGYLLVHRGTVEAFDGDELAFVLAHELAHVQLRHYANGSNLSSALEQLSEVERARAGRYEPADRQKLFEVKKLLAHYGRQLEFEADLYGLLFLVRAGRPAEAAFSAMRKLGALEVGRVATVLDGHPTAPQREADLRKGLASLQRSHARFDDGVAAMQAGRFAEAVPAFEDFLTVFPQSTAAWTNLAVAHHTLLASGDDDPWYERMPVRVKSGVQVRDRVAAGRAYDAASRALALDPDNAVALAVSSSLARRAGALDDARTLLDRAEKAGLDPVSVAVNRGVLDADSETGLRRWEALGDEPFAVANRAVWYDRRGQKGLALALWRSLQGTQLDAVARVALKRAGESPEALPPGEAVAGVALGAPVAAWMKVYGPPAQRREGDLEGFYGWPERGVTAFAYADRVERALCSGACDWTVHGVSLGAPATAVEAALGPPERHALPYGGATWLYPAQGLAFVMDARGVASIEATVRSP